MCQKSKIISSVKNGEISVCKDCKNYNLVFNNIFFQFNEEQLNKFKEYVAEIDINYWLEYSASTTQRRKIPVPTFHQNLVLVFDSYEIEELKILLGISTGNKSEMITTADIDYTLILN
ncbi:hypothetical protein MPF19_08370 [Polaribacter sp. Z014]|uniref:DUF6686 family protein n=1 Tax=unclassified Polaribacter TaxID=196858 RepID=UPI00193C423A|nr:MULTISPECIES: DUF6686 family protein [unclassified Polaribacter]MCL7763424.1 hypothetical protein [Polaribacter sp. Z014]QVY66797.1 hypothetical protein JOP69_05810 [Polaribacter sp. Q13]